MKMRFFSSFANFNPRPYVRGDKHIYITLSGNSHFNPRPYVRGDCKLHRTGHKNRYFNPRPYVRGDLEQSDEIFLFIVISIHAPM